MKTLTCLLTLWLALPVALSPGLKSTASSARPMTCGDSGAAKTITFILHNARFPGRGYTSLDLQIRALKGDAVIRFVRVIKLDPKQ